MSTLSTANIQSKAANTPPVIKDLNGTECGRLCRAWVKYTSSYVIEGSFNVASVTDSATQAFVVFANAMPDNAYAVVGSLDNNVNQEWFQGETTTGFKYAAYTGSAYTNQGASLAVFR